MQEKVKGVNWHAKMRRVMGATDRRIRPKLDEKKR
jgi:hypothetical protein